MTTEMSYAMLGVCAKRATGDCMETQVSEPTKPMVLVVDDDAGTLVSVAATLESIEVEIVTASTFEAAWKIIEERVPDLMVLDVNMPQVNGYALAHILGREEKTKNIPVIFLTGERKEKHHQNIGSQLGAVDYLLKPVEVDILREAVRRQLFKDG